MHIVAEQELFQACKILFGPHLQVSRDFLQYLQHEGVKKAYRRRAFETHPDTCPMHTVADGMLDGVLFPEVKRAYEDLSNYLTARENGFRFVSSCIRPQPFSPEARKEQTRGWNNGRASGWNKGSSSGQRTAGGRGQRKPPRQESENVFSRKQEGRGTVKGPWNGNGRTWSLDGLYEGPMPNRNLLLGHYLYYTGLVSWRQMIQALVWQRMQRPRVGEIARRLGWLNDDDIRVIFENRQILERFGNSAQRLGLLTDFQMKVLLFQQKRQQKKIGLFFVENNVFSAARLEAMVDQCRQHNARVKASQFRAGFSY